MTTKRMHLSRSASAIVLAGLLCGLAPSPGRAQLGLGGGLGLGGDVGLGTDLGLGGGATGGGAANVAIGKGSDGAPGTVFEAESLPALKKAERHDIDVVVDRLRVQPGTQQRLAESFEAALRAADGRAQYWEVPGAGHMGAFSQEPAEYARRIFTLFETELPRNSRTAAIPR